MDSCIEENPIILADFKTLNYLKTFKTSYDKLILNNWTSSFFIPLKFNSKKHLLLNSGVNPFINTPIKKDTGTIIIFISSPWIDKEIYDKKELKYLNDKLTEENPKISSISLSKTNPKYYITDEKEESGPEYRIIVDIEYVNAFNKTDVFNWRKIKSEEPTMLIGAHFDDAYDKKSPERGNGKYIEFDKPFIRQFLMRAQKISYEHFEFGNNIYYLDFPIYTDLMLKTIGGQRYFEGEFRISYEIFASKYYDKLKDNIRTNNLENYCFFVKRGDRFYTMGDPHFEEILDLIYDSLLCVFPIWVKNPKHDCALRSYTILEAIPNIFGYKFEKPVQTVLKEIPMDKYNSLNAKIEKNSAKLIQEEERKKKLEADKIRIMNEKRNKIAQNNAQIQFIARMKKLAKTIAQEAREYVIKKEVSKKREQAKKLIRMKQIAKIIAIEAKEFILKKETNKKSPEIIPEVKLPIINDDNYCDIGSDEYNRRVREWKFEKINPYFFCYPQQQVATLIPNLTPKKDDMWLFNLWNYNNLIYKIY